ncbi:MAG: transposase [Desulfobacterales bacterium]|nr:transposase [Desulfobacterales bacterium]
MPRKARIDAPGALHHIIARGIEKKPIFHDDNDRLNFLERFGTILDETGTPCLAWALMPNHVHLLLKTGLAPISKVMRRLLTGHAQQFNRRHRRHGHLFQNRYKSFLCEEETYLKELVRYIHLNPVRGGGVRNMKQLKRYPFCGHGTLMGALEYTWQDAPSVLKRFGKNIGEARERYSLFVSDGVSMGRRPELVGGGLIRSVGGWSELKALRDTGRHVFSDERILGSSDFAEFALMHAREQLDKEAMAKAAGLDLEMVTEAVSHLFDQAPDLIRSASRKGTVARTRSLICWFAVERLGIRAVEVAKRLDLTPSSVSKLVSRGRVDPLRQKVETMLLER